MIIPSIDLYNKKVVRLYKGLFSKIKYFGYFYEYLNFYNTILIKKLHIVILDNIFKKKNILFNYINCIKIQIGGGIDKKNKIDFLKNKINNFVIGSLLFNNKKEFKKILSYYKNKIIVGLDCYDKTIVINGWIKNTKKTFEYMFMYLYDINIKKILYTNIEKDGTLFGLKNEDIFFLEKKSLFCKFIISGGISGYFNIIKIKNFFLYDYIIGISLYKFNFKISEII